MHSKRVLTGPQIASLPPNPHLPSKQKKMPRSKHHASNWAIHFDFYFTSVFSGSLPISLPAVITCCANSHPKHTSPFFSPIFILLILSSSISIPINKAACCCGLPRNRRRRLLRFWIPSSEYPNHLIAFGHTHPQSFRFWSVLRCFRWPQTANNSVARFV